MSSAALVAPGRAAETPTAAAERKTAIRWAAVASAIVPLAASLGLPAPPAALAGALFAVHPIHTEVVANIVGRAEILAAGLALLALLWWRAAGRGTRPLLASAGAVAAYGLALFAKENATAFLVLLPLADLVATDGGSVRLFLRRLRGRRAAFYLALLAATARYLALRRAALRDLIGGGGGGAAGAAGRPRS